MQDNILHLIQSLSPQDVASGKHHLACIYLFEVFTASVPMSSSSSRIVNVYIYNTVASQMRCLDM